jgi:chromosomal replication initiator protein
MNATWQHIQGFLEKGLHPGMYKVWIKPLQAEVQDNHICLVAPNEFVADWVRDKLMDKIEEAASQVLGQDPRISVRAMAQEEAKAHKPLKKPRAGRREGEGTQNGLPMQVASPGHAVTRWRFTFDDFVVGPSNQLAYAASQSICDKSLGSDSLFLSSDPGLGKTHLLHAIGRHLVVGANRDQVRIRYLTAEEFATHMVLALRAREMERFKAAFRDSIDVLLLEDIHFLQNKEKIQAELLCTLKSLNDRGCRVVFTSSFLPRELDSVDTQLASRFCQGFLAVIDKPDFDTRCRIIQNKARDIFQVQVPRDVSELLASRIKNDVRQLESCLQNLVFKARLMGGQITCDLASRVLENYAPDDSGPGLDRIVDAVCEVYELTPGELKSKTKKRGVVIARDTAFLLARRHTDLSLKEIGNTFNRRHSTVLKGITRLEQELSKQTPLGRQINRTLGMLKF